MFLVFPILLQVKPACAGSSIGVDVAFGVNDALIKANNLITEVCILLDIKLMKNILKFKQLLDVVIIWLTLDN
jgi:hypothetical protein